MIAEITNEVGVNRTLSSVTKKIYAREITRMIDELKIDFNNQKNLRDTIIEKYRANGVPFQNLQQGLYAVNHYFEKLSMDKPFELKKDYITKLQKEYQKVVPVREAKPTTIPWETIKTKSRAFLKADNNNIMDKLIIALYVLIPARRSEYCSLKWGDKQDGENRLSENGDLNIDNYKTQKTYGMYSINLFEPSKLLPKRDADIFKSIIDSIDNKPINALVFQASNKPYSIVSFATRARNLFSKILGEKVGLLDVRRAFEEYARRTIFNNAKLSLKKRNEYKRIYELATGHSNATQNNYADKLELLDDLQEN